MKKLIVQDIAKGIVDRLGGLDRRVRSYGAAGLVGVFALGLVARGGDEGTMTPTSTSTEAVATSVETTAGNVTVKIRSYAGEEGPVWDLANLDHERVDFWVERFQNDPDMREKLEKFLRRSGRYVPMISAKLAERNMPQDLIYLAMIESGFHPQAYSAADASGLWQFIAETGARYGLAVNRAVDERNDPVRATDAALDYLEELHERFDSWYLAAAAYNTGENRVGRIMRENFGREQARSESDYYLIWPHLPRETRDYVPLMVAAGRIAKEPAAYGFDVTELDDPLVYEEIEVDPATPLLAVAQAARIDVEEIRALNPHLKLDRTPNNQRYAVRLPEGAGEVFASNWEAVQQEPVAQYALATHRVQRGESLWTIARRHGITVSHLRSANGLRSDRLQVGQVLQVPAD